MKNEKTSPTESATNSFGLRSTPHPVAVATWRFIINTGITGLPTKNVVILLTVTGWGVAGKFCLKWSHVWSWRFQKDVLPLHNTTKPFTVYKNLAAKGIMGWFIIIRMEAEDCFPKTRVDKAMQKRAPGCLRCIGDYTTQSSGDYNNPV